MQRDDRVLDDLARVVTGALGALHGAKGELTARFRDQLERLAADLELVSREEFDAVKAMAVRARGENEALAARLEAIEARLGAAPRERAAPKARAMAAKTKTTAKTRAKGRTKSAAGKTKARAGARRGRTRAG